MEHSVPTPLPRSAHPSDRQSHEEGSRNDAKRLDRSAQYQERCQDPEELIVRFHTPIAELPDPLAFDLLPSIVREPSPSRRNSFAVFRISKSYKRLLRKLLGGSEIPVNNVRVSYNLHAPKASYLRSAASTFD